MDHRLVMLEVLLSDKSGSVSEVFEIAGHTGASIKGISMVGYRFLFLFCFQCVLCLCGIFVKKDLSFSSNFAFVELVRP